MRSKNSCLDNARQERFAGIVCADGSNLRSPQGLTVTARTGRITIIDPARFIAVTSVLVFHYGFRGFRADGMTQFGLPDIETYAAYGFYGVHFFFVISGFVIGMTVRNSTPRSFFVSRASRLYPAFWIGCTLTFLTGIIFQDPRYHVSLPTFVVNLTMLAGFTQPPTGGGVPYVDGAYWSLTEEIRFYFLVAGVLWLSRRWQKWLPKKNQPLWGIGFWLLIATFGLARKNGQIEFFFAPKWAGYFCLGLLCFLVYNGTRTKWLILEMLWAFAMMLVAAHRELSNLRVVYRFDYNYVATVAILTGTFGFVLLIAMRRIGSVPFPMFATMLGAATYPIYLLHQHVGYMLFNKFYNGQHPVFWFVGVTFFMVISGFGISQLLEKPVMVWLRAQLSKVHG
jgi:peptidoglycan/LPS O-acetylase OafA/YrhL